jgi:hypothetical protein
MVHCCLYLDHSHFTCQSSFIHTFLFISGSFHAGYSFSFLLTIFSLLLWLPLFLYLYSLSPAFQRLSFISLCVFVFFFLVTFCLLSLLFHDIAPANSFPLLSLFPSSFLLFLSSSVSLKSTVSEPISLCLS